MEQLSLFIKQSLEPNAAIRRTAEKEIDQLQRQPQFNFGQVALQIAATPTLDKSIRQGAAVSFKNWIKKYWDDEASEAPIVDPQRTLLKDSIVNIHVSLVDSPRLQAQLDEAIAAMAESDFPQRWPSLVDQLLSHLSPTNFQQNNAVLSIMHSICRGWRIMFRSNELFSTINFVLSRFSQPYLDLFRQTDQVISSPNPPCPVPVLATTLRLLLELFYDFNCQDLPEFFEDNMPNFMPLIHKFLTFNHPTLQSTDDEDDEDAEAGELEKIRATICEIAEMYSQRYTEEFKMMADFVGTVWNMVISLSSSRKYDALVAKAVGFLSVVVKMGSQKEMFQDRSTLESFCEKIVLPNMTLRTFEIELFDDDPMEYVRRDFETSLEVVTRRHAATEFVRALMEQFEGPVTSIIQNYNNAYIQRYTSDPVSNWKDKDTAIYLLTSIASRSSTTYGGVTSTNALVDVIQFFSTNILCDLQNASVNPQAVHPIILADAIKFLHTFRNQLTKDQLVSVLPLLVPYLKDARLVIVSYASITIERVLYVKKDGELIVTQTDITPYAQEILAALFATIEKGTTPQEISQNEHLMKCVMRVLLTAKQGILPYSQQILQSLVHIIAEISKNPSNPKFNHYTFESVASLIRFTVAANPSSLGDFEGHLIPQFQVILTQDVAEFMPFAFQIISQLVELHTEANLPDMYKELVQPILHGSLWLSRGNVPPLIRLLKAFMSKSATGDVFNAQQLEAVRDIVRHLVPIKAHDAYSWELIEALLRSVPTQSLMGIIKDIYIILLTRLMQAKTTPFTKGFIREMLLPIAIDKPGLGPDELIAALDSIEPSLFIKVFQSLVGDIQRTDQRDRKVVCVGLAKLLTQSQRMVAGEGASTWGPICGALMKLLTGGQDLTKDEKSRQEADEIDVVDLEDMSYQASYSRLASSEGPRREPVSGVPDERTFFAQALARASQSYPDKFGPLFSSIPTEQLEAFRPYLTQEGLTV